MWNLVSFVKRGKIRTNALKLLSSPKSPTEVAKEIGAHREAVSRAIIALEKKRLVKCLTPKEKAYRLYGLTAKGGKVLKYL